jgi:hypothetical protein
MTTPLNADLPDWSVLTNPLILNASFNAILPGNLLHLFQSVSPYRIWAAWITLVGSATAAYVNAFSQYGAQIGDGSGASLLRASFAVQAASQTGQCSIALPINGYTPIISGGLYTTNLITDAGIGNVNARVNAGILFSIP